MKGFIAVFEIDIRMVACLITYYLQFLRVPESDLQVNKSMDVSQGDMSLAIIPDDVMVPDTFQRAYAKLQELDVQEEDCIFMRLQAGDSSSENEWLDVDVWKENDDLFYCEQQAVGGRDALERRRSYRNFDCIYFYIHTKIYRELICFSDPDFMMRFLTDYFLFLYPQVRQEDIVTSLVCVKEIGYDDVLYKEYFFYPDGSEDSPEKLVDFITTMQNWRKSN